MTNAEQMTNAVNEACAQADAWNAHEAETALALAYASAEAERIMADLAYAQSRHDHATNGKRMADERLASILAVLAPMMPAAPTASAHKANGTVSPIKATKRAAAKRSA